MEHQDLAQLKALYRGGVHLVNWWVVTRSCGQAEVNGRKCPAIT
jgi:hypothetical protein